MYIIIAILLFGVLIAVHEFGHFIVAKLCGVRVFEFAIGMGPKILTIKQGKETLYTWRALPIGGFCAMDEDSSSDDPRAFTNQKAWKRAAILLAGSFMNLLFGFLLVMLLAPSMFPSGHWTPEVTKVLDDSKFEVGDVIQKIDGERIHSASDVIFFLNWHGPQHDIVVKRDGQIVEFTIDKNVLDHKDGELRYGLTLDKHETGFGGVLKAAWYQYTGYVRLVRLSLAELFSGAVGLGDLSGPVGIVSFINETGQQAENVGSALISISSFGAFIAINLAVMNLLPIPALDGGRIFFLIITQIVERISKRKLDPKYEGYIHGAMYVLLLGLMAFVMINDVLKIIRGG